MKQTTSYFDNYDIVPKSSNSIIFQECSKQLKNNLMLSETTDVYIVSETIAIKSVKITKEITVVTKIARTIELGFTL